MKYTDLIPGQIYVGYIPQNKTRWLFIYTPCETQTVENWMSHRGPCIHLSRTKKLLKNGDLWNFDRGWEFSEASPEEKNLLQKNTIYEIY